MEKSFNAFLPFFLNKKYPALQRIRQTHRKQTQDKQKNHPFAHLNFRETWAGLAI